MGIKHRKKGFYNIDYRVCEFCNKLFVVYPSHRPARFCSLSCAARWHNINKPQNYGGTKNVICAQCETAFTAWRHEINRKFCSLKCKLEYGKLHTIDMARLRDMAYDRDKGRCVDCDSRRFTEIHHINGNPRDCHLDNLITLCKKCHIHRHVVLNNGLNSNGTRSRYKE